MITVKARLTGVIGILGIALALAMGCMITNSPPVASFVSDVSSGNSPLLVHFDASSSYDSDGSIARYEWDFGNGETQTYQYVETAIALYITESSRTYTVALVVTDDDGAQATATKTISVEPWQPPPEPEPVHNFSGHGQQVTPLFTLTEGLAIFRMTHDGNSNFIVWLEDDEANLVELLVNEIGSFDGSKSVHIGNTVRYLLDILADGDWTVVIEQ